MYNVNCDVNVIFFIDKWQNKCESLSMEQKYQERSKQKIQWPMELMKMCSFDGFEQTKTQLSHLVGVSISNGK